jgi:hypothetical protein
LHLVAADFPGDAEGYDAEDNDYDVFEATGNSDHDEHEDAKHRENPNVHLVAADIPDDADNDVEANDDDNDAFGANGNSGYDDNDDVKRQENHNLRLVAADIPDDDDCKDDDNDHEYSEDSDDDNDVFYSDRDDDHDDVRHHENPNLHSVAADFPDDAEDNDVDDNDDDNDIFDASGNNGHDDNDDVRRQENPNLRLVVSAEIVADELQLVAIDAEMASINASSASAGGDSLQQQDAASRAWLVLSRENAFGGTLWTKSSCGKVAHNALIWSCDREVCLRWHMTTRINFVQQHRGKIPKQIAIQLFPSEDEFERLRTLPPSQVMMFINEFVGLYSEFFVNTCRFCFSNY